jgi:hypothetical protein
LNRFAPIQATPQKKIILSASRRTDIPAFYMPWFMERIKQGDFEVDNPYNGRTSRVPATTDRVHTIVFWSKDFGPFLRGGFGEKLAARGYHLFFNFTINSECPDLEPGVPLLDARLNQLEMLCDRFSPRSIHWRFDPICFFITPDGLRDNLGDFGAIADKVHQLGIKRCVTSFLDLYPKIRKRTEGRPDFSFVSPSLEKQKETILGMQSQLKPRGIALLTCCEKELSEALPPAAGILPSACIPSKLIVDLYGGEISVRKDPGQRASAGCECGISSDIGSYKNHPCHHNCLFCYANPAAYRNTYGRERKQPGGAGA